MRIDELEQRLADAASQQPAGAADPVGAVRHRVARQRRRRLATAVAVLAVAAFGSVVLVTRDDGGSQRVVTQPPDTSTLQSLPAPTESSAAASPSTTDTTAVAIEPTTETTATTTALTGEAGCRNSTDPQCGPFFYDWPTDNRPATISIAASPTDPAVGEKVTFTVTIDDPDGPPISRCYSIDPDATHVEPNGQANTTMICADGVAPGYGPWDPPPPWHAVETYDVTYQVAGDHIVRYRTEEAGRATSDSVPRASAELTVTVAAI